MLLFLAWLVHQSHGLQVFDSIVSTALHSLRGAHLCKKSYHPLNLHDHMTKSCNYTSDLWLGVACTGAREEGKAMVHKQGEHSSL